MEYELVTRIESHIENLRALETFLESTEVDDDVVKAQLDGEVSTLLTGVDYLIVNLTMMANRVRML